MSNPEQTRATSKHVEDPLSEARNVDMAHDLLIVGTKCLRDDYEQDYSAWESKMLANCPSDLRDKVRSSLGNVWAVIQRTDPVCISRAYGKTVEHFPGDIFGGSCQPAELLPHPKAAIKQALIQAFKLIQDPKAKSSIVHCYRMLPSYVDFRTHHKYFALKLVCEHYLNEVMSDQKLLKQSPNALPWLEEFQIEKKKMRAEAVVERAQCNRELEENGMCRSSSAEQS